MLKLLDRAGRPLPEGSWRRELKRCRTRGVIRAGCPALRPRTPGISNPEAGHNEAVGDGARLRFRAAPAGRQVAVSQMG